jgi:hypothetical protein
MTVQYTLRVGAGFTIQFFQFLYSMFRCISVGSYDTGHTSRLLIFSEWEHGSGIYADNAQLFLVAGPGITGTSIIRTVKTSASWSETPELQLA